MIDCKTIAAERKKYLKEYIEQNNKDLCLMVIQVGDDPASNSYIRGKMQDCMEVGIRFLHKRFDVSVTTNEIIRICRGEDGKLCGDVDKSCYGDQMLITPVPGGVGLMTRVALLENLVYGGN